MREREEEKGNAQLLFSRNKKKQQTQTPPILKAHFCFLALKVPAVMVYLMSSVF